MAAFKGTWTTTYPSYNQDILNGYRQRYDSAMATLNNWGAQQYADLRQQYASARNAGIQDLVNSNMLYTTAAPSVRMGFARQESDAARRLGEDLNRQKLQYQTDLSGDILAYQTAAEQAARANSLADRQLGFQYASLYDRQPSTPRPGGAVGFTTMPYEPYSLGSNFALPIGRLW